MVETASCRRPPQGIPGLIVRQECDTARLSHRLDLEGTWRRAWDKITMRMAYPAILNAARSR
jgi:hypothetical protein